jgi:hypothetical protein
MKRPKIEKGLRALLAAIMLGATLSAQAAVVTVDATHPYQDVGFISGTGGVTNAFDIALAGSYQAKLTDFKFPDAFQTLQLIVTSATDEYGRITEPGSFSFDATPGRYYVSVMGKAHPPFDLGLYGVWIGAAAVQPPVAPVAIPAAGLLMLSALGVLAVIRRRGGELGSGPLAA